MIVVRREDFARESNPTIAIPADDVHPTGDERGNPERARDDIFSQLEDEERVVTSGRGSRLPVTDSDGGTAPSGYSAGISSGSGAD